MSDANLRRLVENASRIEVAGDAGRRPAAHPLDPGIRRKKSYTTPFGKISLPNRPEGLPNLERALTTPVLDLSAEVGRRVTAAMLDSPTVVLDLQAPDDGTVARFSAAVPTGMMSRLRHIAIARVFDVPSRFETGGESATHRIAGGGELLVLLNPALTHTDDAWLLSKWSESTTGLGRWLEVQLGAFAGRLETLTDRTVTVLLVGEDPKVWGVLGANVLDRCAAAYGLRATVVRATNSNHPQMAAALRGNASNYLIGVGPYSERMASLFDVARDAGTIPTLLGDIEEENVMTDMREALASLTGLGMGLTALTEPLLGEEVEEDRLKVPIHRPVTCYHDGSERFYVLDEETGLYWTVDDAHHGGAVYKTYTMVNRTLHHQACRDADGLVMEDKTKGSKGKTIELSVLHHCAWPRSHARPPR